MAIHIDSVIVSFIIIIFLMLDFPFCQRITWRRVVSVQMPMSALQLNPLAHILEKPNKPNSQCCPLQSPYNERQPKHLNVNKKLGTYLRSSTNWVGSLGSASTEAFTTTLETSFRRGVSWIVSAEKQNFLIIYYICSKISFGCN